MITFRNFILLIYILNLLSKIKCQLENESVTKTLACMTVLNQKFQGGEPDASVYSTMMLKCFISISESKAKKILLELETGKISLSKKEVDKLTDYESLQSYSQSELKRKSRELEKALKTFKKMQEEITGGKGDIDPDDYDNDDDDYDDDEYYHGETPSNVNFFSLLPRGIKGIFNVFNNYLSLFFIFVIVYFGLLMIRKINDSERKMKKKMKEQYEEEEEEEEEYELNNNKNKKYKRI